ncbi:MAG: dephospho-CoA kinase [Candidatus Geothermincolales bacterium]
MALFLVALTGGIASGKSTVGKCLARKGAFLIESDALARKVVEKGSEAYREIVEHFGEGILDHQGNIDREKLGAVVFHDPSEREFLNRVTHPRILALMAEQIETIRKESGNEAIVVLDIPLLVEAGAARAFDFTLVVDASPETQEERLVTDRGLTREDAKARIACQASREERLRVADFVIHNEGSLEDLEKEVERAWSAILEAKEKRNENGQKGL